MVQTTLLEQSQAVDEEGLGDGRHAGLLVFPSAHGADYVLYHLSLLRSLLDTDWSNAGE